MMLYFAYGSNLDCGQMRSRCPSTQFVCRAVLKDHSLAFTRSLPPVQQRPPCRQRMCEIVQDCAFWRVLVCVAANEAFLRWKDVYRNRLSPMSYVIPWARWQRTGWPDVTQKDDTLFCPFS